MVDLWLRILKSRVLGFFGNANFKSPIKDRLKGKSPATTQPSSASPNLTKSATKKQKPKTRARKTLMRKADAKNPSDIETASTFFPESFADTPGWYNRHCDDFCYYSHYIRQPSYFITMVMTRFAVLEKLCRDAGGESVQNERFPLYSYRVFVLLWSAFRHLLETKEWLGPVDKLVKV